MNRLEQNSAGKREGSRMKHYGDITKLNGADLPPVDCITGGSPCQDLSVAGKRAGLAGERSGLFMEQIRVIKEMRENDRRNGRPAHLCRPRFMVWENVPGAFSSNQGKDFQTVLTEIVRIVCPDCPDVPMSDRGGGETQDASMMSWADGLLLGAYTPQSFGARPREENVCALSQILEDLPHQRYCLSGKACIGILRRVEKKKKVLPDLLWKALKEQAMEDS